MVDVRLRTIVSTSHETDVSKIEAQYLECGVWRLDKEAETQERALSHHAQRGSFGAPSFGGGTNSKIEKTRLFLTTNKDLFCYGLSLSTQLFRG